MNATLGLVKRLEQEWRVLAETSRARRSLASWADAEPALREWPTLADLRAATEDRQQPQRSDAILAALARLAAQDGGNDELAARVLLQLLLPGAVSLARRLRGYFGGDLIESESTVLAELTARIRSYPWQRRPARIAANLLLDTHHELARQGRRDQGMLLGLDPSDLDHHSDPGADPATNRDQYDLIDLFTWATRSEVLTPEQALILAANRVDEQSIGDLATRTGRSQPTLFRIRAKAEKQLRAHLPAYVRELQAA